ncbi:MAG: hypothetical protein CM15mP46_6630 [Alphaproteobacteria bacterium]|nr:MAG: hypothetical protein CM15mP46_6630 [Alphaproteobacteria bacterium]
MLSGIILSTFENRIDKRAPIRTGSFQQRPLGVISAWLYCLEIFFPSHALRAAALNELSRLLTPLTAHGRLVQRRLHLADHVIESAQEMKLDAEGRIMLNADFVEFAELDGTLSLAWAFFSRFGYQNDIAAARRCARRKPKPMACPAFVLAGARLSRLSATVEVGDGA